MKKRAAILMDGGFVTKVIGRDADPRIQASRMVKLAEACILPDDEELFRLFYYDCAPYGGKRKDLSGGLVDFSLKQQFEYQTQLLGEIGTKEYVAVRLGEVRFRGWKPRKHVGNRIWRAGVAGFRIYPKDFEANFQQKGVDMRVGLDVATLSMNRLVERIVLVAADSDFIPAMKLARREGVQIVLAKLGQKSVKELEGHADLYREPDYAKI